MNAVLLVTIKIIDSDNRAIRGLLYFDARGRVSKNCIVGDPYAAVIDDYAIIAIMNVIFTNRVINSIDVQINARIFAIGDSASCDPILACHVAHSIEAKAQSMRLTMMHVQVFKG